jgi:hypothetical protein
MRTIESPGVEIKEIDLSFNTELPYGTTSLVVGYAKQGPTDELLNITSAEELEQVYGLPENAAERYMYQTARQILNANGNMLITRLPYGSGDGEGYTSRYSALVYPYLPIDVTCPGDTYALQLEASQAADFDVYTLSSSGYNVTTDKFSLVVASSSIYVSDSLTTQFDFDATFTVGGSSVNATLTFDTSGSVVNASTIPTLSGVSSLSAAKFYGAWTSSSYTSADVYVGETSPESVYTALISANSSAYAFTSGVINANITYQDGISGNAGFSASDASHYFLGEPIHIAIDEDTYFNWLQGGINWKSTVTKDVSGLTDTTDINTILANVGYGAMVVVNEAKTTIDDKFAGYYIAIADNSKMDKGSNFDSISRIKSFNQYSEENEWVELNPQSLAFSMTGSYFEHAGSVSEIVESTADFDFSNTGPGGFGDSIVLAMFKVRPSIYNQDERVLDKVLYEAHLGSFDSTRQLQNQAGGAPVNFFLEDAVNKSSNTMKVFINPYISRFSGSWYDTQTQEPTKFVRVVCGERSVLGSSTEEIIDVSPAQPHSTAKVIFDAINAEKNDYCTLADNLYGIGEAVPCEAQLQKSIGNLPRKLEKALRLAENYELLRLDLVPEAGLGTIWTGMNLDMNNWPANATNRTNFTRVKEIYDDTVYIDGILTPHTFDADSDGLLSQVNGSSSEASDLYESIATIFNQFCQFTRKDCLQIADPLRHIFVQGSGEVKVMDNKKLNFSQHIFWPLKNLFGGLNTSYACTYANWFKVNDTISDRFVWAPASGYMANLMIKTDTNFFPWYAPAGLTRGILSGLVDIAINPTQKQRDLLYKNGINPTVYWPGDGYVVWGQKTLQKKPSAFDRINVRRLFLWAEKAVLQIARYFVFEQNTPFTRNRLKAAIDPVLAFARSNEGIYDYLIVCDDRNNPPEVRDRNEMVVDIYIKPVRVAEFILINFIATRTSQRFDELI